MNHAFTIAGKEFRTYFKTPVAYVFLVVFLGFVGWNFFFNPDYFTTGEASMRNFFGMLPMVFLFLAPAVSMKMWAEERKIGTIETLMTMPMREHEIVLGKFLAALGLITVALVLTFPTAVIVSFTAASSVDLGPIIGGYVAALLMGGAYLAIGLFASALTESQIVAFIVGAVICVLMILIGVEGFVALLPKGVAETCVNLSLISHFENIQRGVLDSRDLLYYASVLTFFLMLNVAAARRR
ncbi:MAG TPA: ABC transporter permease [Pirellulaceae bacterium]|nr:ABC transporter permease [Pirellulaceae bacterium]